MAKSKRVKSKQQAIKVHIAKLKAAQAEIAELKGKLCAIVAVIAEGEKQHETEKADLLRMCAGFVDELIKLRSAEQHAR